MTPMKGHDVLVAALATLPELPWRCTCAGPVSPDPDFVERVTEQARRAGIDHRIHLVGPLDRTTLDQTYAAADVLVHPSRVETYGMVVTDAWRTASRHRHVGGRRPRRPRHGGARDARADGRPGLLVPADDAAALAAALRTWLTDAALRERLRQRARSAGPPPPLVAHGGAGVGRPRDSRGTDERLNRTEPDTGNSRRPS